MIWDLNLLDPIVNLSGTGLVCQVRGKMGILSGLDPNAVNQGTRGKSSSEQKASFILKLNAKPKQTKQGRKNKVATETTKCKGKRQSTNQNQGSNQKCKNAKLEIQKHIPEGMGS